MRTVFLAATALVAFLSQAIAQDQIDAAKDHPTPKAKPINPDSTMPNGRLYYDVPCRVSSVGTCITEPPPYRPMKK